MAHQFDLNIQTLYKIDLLLPRLKHSVLPTRIIRWLENFEADEVDLAIDLLSVLEYIPFNEFMFRLNDLLEELLQTIPEGERIIIIPYGKVGKSATLVTYPLKNTTAFQKRNDDIELTHDYENLANPEQYNHIVFIDDFIGSGNTFCEEYLTINNIEKWVSDNDIENVYVLASVIMAEGKGNIENQFPNIKIYAEVRHKIFDQIYSPLKAFGNIKNIEALSLKYGIQLGSLPFGYDNSQTMLSFFHCTPNNTLPLIWVKKSIWFPIYPRNAKIRMDEAREFKKEIAFFIGICNRLGIDIFTGKSIIEERKQKSVRIIKHNTKQHHSVIALLTLKNMGYDNLIICHLLGLTRNELKLIYKEAIILGYIDKIYNINVNGIQFLKELKSRTGKENFRKETKENLTPKDDLYLPQKFKGLT